MSTKKKYRSIAFRARDCCKAAQFLARGERADALERKGLVIEPIFSPGRKTSRNPIIRNLERDDIYDVIFVVIRPSEFEESPQKTPLA